MLLRSIIFLAFLTMSLPVKAQFHITPQVGYTFSSIMQYEKNHNRYVYSQIYDKIKPAFGVMASKNLSKNLFLQTDIFYSQKGAHIIDGFIPDFSWTELNSEHLDIGIQIGYTFLDKLTIESGVYYSQLLNMKIEVLNGWTTPGIYEIDGERYYDDNETGASLGLSYTLYNITARAKYSFGIWGTREAEKHHWFLLTLGYRFEL